MKLGAGSWARLGRAARTKVLAEYSWRAQVAKMEQVYEELGV